MKSNGVPSAAERLLDLSAELDVFKIAVQVLITTHPEQEAILQVFEELALAHTDHLREAAVETDIHPSVAKEAAERFYAKATEFLQFFGK